VQEITHYNAASRTGPHKPVAPNVMRGKGHECMRGNCTMNVEARVKKLSL